MMNEKLRERIEQWRDKEKLEASRHTSSQWIWGNHMAAAKAYEKVLAALAEKPADDYDAPERRRARDLVTVTMAVVSGAPADNLPEDCAAIVKHWMERLKVERIDVAEKPAERPADLEGNDFREWLKAKRVTLTDEQLWAVESYIVINLARAERPQLSAEKIEDLLEDIYGMTSEDEEAFGKKLRALLTGEAEKVPPRTTPGGYADGDYLQTVAPAAPPVLQAEPHLKRAQEAIKGFWLPGGQHLEIAKVFAGKLAQAERAARLDEANLWNTKASKGPIPTQWRLDRLRALADSPVSGVTTKEGE